jgi:hypothetical protein
VEQVKIGELALAAPAVEPPKVTPPADTKPAVKEFVPPNRGAALVIDYTKAINDLYCDLMNRVSQAEPAQVCKSLLDVGL